MVIYDTDPTRAIGDWKEAWEKAKERAGAILRGEVEKPKLMWQKREREEGAEGTEKRSNGKDGKQKPESLKCRFHDLRHSAVTRLLEAGVPSPVVASMMGWSAANAIRMAKRYGHIGSHALQHAANVLGRTKISLGSLKKSPKSLDVRNAAIQ